jgi:hypothetical protein
MAQEETSELRRLYEEALNQLEGAEKRADDERRRAEAAEKQADEERSRAEAAEKQADEERRRAETAQKQADEERSRAEAAEKRADEERKRADSAAREVVSVLTELLHAIITCVSHFGSQVSSGTIPSFDEYITSGTVSDPMQFYRMIRNAIPKKFVTKTDLVSFNAASWKYYVARLRLCEGVESNLYDPISLLLASQKSIRFSRGMGSGSVRPDFAVPIGESSEVLIPVSDDDVKTWLCQSRPEPPAAVDDLKVEPPQHFFDYESVLEVKLSMSEHFNHGLYQVIGRTACRRHTSDSLNLDIKVLLSDYPFVGCFCDKTEICFVLIDLAQRARDFIDKGSPVWDKRRVLTVKHFSTNWDSLLSHLFLVLFSKAAGMKAAAESVLKPLHNLDLGLVHLQTSSDIRIDFHLERLLSNKPGTIIGSISSVLDAPGPCYVKIRSFDSASLVFEASVIRRLNDLGVRNIPRLVADGIDLLFNRSVLVAFPAGRTVSNLQSAQLSLKDLVRDILQALQDMHRNHWIHGDVKPDNIIENEGRYILIDFESAIRRQEGFSSEFHNLKWTRLFASRRRLEADDVVFSDDLESLLLTSYFLDSNDDERKMFLSEASEGSKKDEILTNLQKSPPAWLTENPELLAMYLSSPESEFHSLQSKLEWKLSAISKSAQNAVQMDRYTLPLYKKIRTH